MNPQWNKNLLKKIVGLAGVASASALLSFPAFALTNSDASSSKQPLNNHNYRIDLNGQLLAQNNPQTQENQPSSTTDGNNRVNEQMTKDRSDQASKEYSPADSNGRGMRALTGGDSVKGINWICLNNPNPNCGR